MIEDDSTLESTEEDSSSEGNDNSEIFFYLPNGFAVDSSLQKCLNDRTNTMSLVESKNKSKFVTRRKNIILFIHQNLFRGQI